MSRPNLRPDSADDFNALEERIKKLELALQHVGASQLPFRYLATGTPAAAQYMVKTGVSSPFVNGIAQTTDTTVAHGLGVTPSVVFVGSVVSDSDLWVASWRRDVTTDATNFTWVARAMAGGTHGPGTLDPFPWMAIGIVP